ncbi:GntP family permease [Halalkalicoccus sp. GCM10025322]|uniref:GntP family permease n=1 Tax=Halalkalicoccus TaxID=332246 RepID=UPI002F963B28
MFENPLIPFVIGLLSVIILLVWLKLPAFFGLIIATFIVGVFTAEVPIADVPAETADAFGSVLISIGIPILMAAIIGKTLMESGAADRIVRAFLSLTGKGRSEYALFGSSFILSIPVFFDNVFYLLAPIARSTRARTGGRFAIYVCVLSAGALGTHMLVPPTPGPLAMASELGVNLGLAIVVGVTVALPTTLVGGVVYGRWIDHRMEIPLREAMGTTVEEIEEVAAKSKSDLPNLVESLLPIAAPVIFITGNTVSTTVFPEDSPIVAATTFLGDPNMALTIAALLSTWTFFRMRDISKEILGDELTEAIKSGGNIIAITAAGGAFGAMLQASGIGEYISGGLSEAGIPLLISGWLIAGLIRIAQGSGTVAILTGASIMAPLADSLPLHPVWMMMAVGTGGMLFAWYNDSGFWIVNEVAGLTQKETFKTFSAVNFVMSITGIIVVLILSTLFPLT